MLDILEAETEVIFAISGEGAFASFFGEVSVDAGEVLGQATVTVHAQAEIGNYLNDGNRVRALESSINTSRDLQVDSLLDADWDLEIDFKYQPPQWTKDVGNAIAEGAKVAAAEIENTWNTITDFAVNTFNAALDLAQQLGDEISKIFTAVADFIGDAGGSVDEAIDAAAGFFGSNDMGFISDFLVGAGSIVGFGFDLVEASFEIGASILSGNFDDIDDIAWDTFSSSDYKATKLSSTVGSFDCPKIIKGELYYLVGWG